MLLPDGITCFVHVFKTSFPFRSKKSFWMKKYYTKNGEERKKSLFFPKLCIEKRTHISKMKKKHLQTKEINKSRIRVGKIYLKVSTKSDKNEETDRFSAKVIFRERKKEIVIKRLFCFFVLVIFLRNQSLHRRKYEAFWCLEGFAIHVHCGTY